MAAWRQFVHRRYTTLFPMWTISGYTTVHIVQLSSFVISYYLVKQFIGAFKEPTSSHVGMDNFSTIWSRGIIDSALLHQGNVGRNAR